MVDEIHRASRELILGCKRLRGRVADALFVVLRGIRGRSLGYQTSHRSLHFQDRLPEIPNRRIIPRKSYRTSPGISFHMFISNPIPCSYNRQQLYKVVADVDSYNKFIPFCTGSKVLSRREPLRDLKIPDGFSMDAELTVGFLSFTESYVSKVTCSPYDSVKVSLSSRGAPHPPGLITSTLVRPSHPPPRLCSKPSKPLGNLSPSRMPLKGRSLLSSNTISSLHLRTPCTLLFPQSSLDGFQT